MTPQEMARIHAAAFAPERGWSASEFDSMCHTPQVVPYLRPLAFALTRTVADETELLTLATHPAAQRQGFARALLENWLSETEAQLAFLEVAADNTPAQRLYAQLGFVETGRRRNYYARSGASRVDALLMQKALTCRHDDKSAPTGAKTG